MIITICILILAYTLKGKPIGELVEKVKDVEWKDIAQRIGDSVKAFCLKAGRKASLPLLTFYYVITDENTQVKDKALVYGALLYIISPLDLVPRKILGLLGVLDDAAVSVLVYKKISASVTPEIEKKVNATLSEWFGDDDNTKVGFVGE